MTDYNNFAETFSKSRKKMKWPEIDEIIFDIQKNNFEKILDIGCGSGRFLEQYLSTTGELPKKYLGVDASEKMLIEAKKQWKDFDFITSTMENFLSKLAKQNVEVVEVGEENYFDAIIFLASFHHIDTEEKRKEILQNAQKILGKNGKIYMTNWNLLGQEKYFSSHIGNNNFQMKIGNFTRYYHGFSLDELEKLFLEGEFIIEKNEIFEGGKNILSIIKNKNY